MHFDIYEKKCIKKIYKKINKIWTFKSILIDFN